VQELHGAGPVRPQHHVIIAEAVVELAHAGRRPLRLSCTLHTLAVTTTCLSRARSKQLHYLRGRGRGRGDSML
jgi:hypothetical protein